MSLAVKEVEKLVDLLKSPVCMHQELKDLIAERDVLEDLEVKVVVKVLLWEVFLNFKK